ncbi:receptor protein kinase TMK1-like [Lolium rigidum]|uniref:receptor protein kinase TMK1-like n=1 Tax=Lolium rigidum TaxID=89674 RepID=UPI001F5D167E|nr:receptor protein kinase TMK1-like [Lolium rigidum]
MLAREVHNLTEVFSKKLTGKLPSLAGLASLHVILVSKKIFTSIADGFFKGPTALTAVNLDETRSSHGRYPPTSSTASPSSTSPSTASTSHARSRSSSAMDLYWYTMGLRLERRSALYGVLLEAEQARPWPRQGRC